VEHFVPLPQFYFDETARNGFTHPWDQWEMLNVSEYSCPHCWASDRDRLMAVYLRRKLNSLSPAGRIRLVEFAPTPPLAPLFQRVPGLEYRSADLSKQGVDDRVDLTDLSIYPDRSVDAFVCSHVLEHVPDDCRAIRELHRILHPGGWGLLIVPISLCLSSIYEDAAVTTDQERWRHFGQNDHVRIYNQQGFLTRLREARFQVTRVGIAEIGQDVFRRHAIPDSGALYIVTH
jgi:SAM-dependent methyltransferase